MLRDVGRRLRHLAHSTWRWLWWAGVLRLFLVGGVAPCRLCADWLTGHLPAVRRRLMFWKK